MLRAPTHRLAQSVLPIMVLLAAGACEGRRPELPIDRAQAREAPAGASLGPGSRAPSAPPGPGEIDQTLRRVFGSALRADATGGSPGYFVGDFNADGSEDLMVVARPSPDALTAINDPLAPWIIRDAQRPTTAHDTAENRVAVAGDDLLMAVVHGYQALGWRSLESRHGYLLRRAVGDHMRARPAAEVIVVSEPGARAVGDVLTGTIEGRGGFLYWTGSRYLWLRL